MHTQDITFSRSLLRNISKRKYIFVVAVLIFFCYLAEALFLKKPGNYGLIQAQRKYVNERKIAKLCTNLKSQEVLDRRDAVSDLLELGPDTSTVIPALFESLLDVDKVVKEGAKRVLIDMGENVGSHLPWLVGNLNSSNRDWVEVSLQMTGNAGQQANGVILKLVDQLYANPKPSGIAIKEVLEKITSKSKKEALPLLRQAFNRKKSDVQAVVVEVMAQAGHEAVGDLKELLGNSDINVRSAAAQQLGKIIFEAAEDIVSVASLLGNEKIEIRYGAVCALETAAKSSIEQRKSWDAKMAKEPMRSLIVGLDDPNKEVRLQTAITIQIMSQAVLRGKESEIDKTSALWLCFREIWDVDELEMTRLLKEAHASATIGR